jgi:hypothetical protein
MLKQAREPDGLRRGGRRAAEITARVYNTWAHQIACSARQVLSEHAAQSAPDRARAFLVGTWLDRHFTAMLA